MLVQGNHVRLDGPEISRKERLQGGNLVRLHRGLSIGVVSQKGNLRSAKESVREINLQDFVVTVVDSDPRQDFGGATLMAG